MVLDARDQRCRSSRPGWRPGHRRRHPRQREHHHAVHRPEPDLYLPSLASGVPARLSVCSMVRQRRDPRRATGKLITNRDLGADGHFGAPAECRYRNRRHGDLGRRQGAGARHSRHQPDRCGRVRRAAAGDRRLRQFHQGPARPAAGRDEEAADGIVGTADEAGWWKATAGADRSDATPCAPAISS